MNILGIIESIININAFNYLFIFFLINLNLKKNSIFCTDEYFKVTGERIPFRQLGFSSLETLIQSSGKFTIQNYGGSVIVQALATSKTQHLTELIKKQKSKPPKKKPVSAYLNK